ncbi:MAG: hypothetical protein R3324_16635 [Halobacteriales archaeon]|nr:hypothetical protein [Halobacteriales archaeon]
MITASRSRERRRRAVREGAQDDLASLLAMPVTPSVYEVPGSHGETVGP